MTPGGITLVILSAVFILSAVTLETLKLKIWLRTSKWFLLIWGLATLIYFIAGRWGFDLYNLINLDNNIYWRSIYFSKVLLLDMCPFLSAFIPICLFFKRTKKIAVLLAPVAIFTGAITLFAEVYKTGLVIDWNYIFIGTFPNRLFFLLHFNLVLLACFILLNYNQKLTLKDYGWSIFISGLYLVIIYLLKLALNVEWNVTGLTANDWIISNVGFQTVEGEYYLTGKILNLKFPEVYGVVVVSFALCVLLVFGIHNYRFSKIHYSLITKIKTKVKLNFNLKKGV